MIRYFVLYFILPAALFAGARDWLIDPAPFRAEVVVEDQSLLLHNGLSARRIRLSPNAATISFRREDTGEEFVRSVRPEAEIVLNGVRYAVGGLVGQPVHNYILPQWLDEMTADPTALQFVDYKIGPTQERFPWKKRLEWMPQDLPWPPPGRQVALTFAAGEQLIQQNPSLKNIRVIVTYEIYDGLPLISKWLSVENNSDQPVRERNSRRGRAAVGRRPTVAVGDAEHERGHRLHFWRRHGGERLYRQERLLGARFAVSNTSELSATDALSFGMPAADRSGRERKGLAERKMYRAVAPWVTENPILMHVRKADDKSVRLAIDQCAEVGFEMVIMTFGSGFNLEDQSPKNIKRMKALADYAHSKGIAIGGYSLLASRSIDADNDVVTPAGKTPAFGHSPCLESEWGRDYFDKLYAFYEQTGMDILEHDGSYPGDVCASTNHPGHAGLKDSQWRQFERISKFYQWCRGKGIYLNVPDWYFLAGSNKIAMGYRETNWSLPRKQQEIIERQNIYDGTWAKTPSMGWMFVPLTQYHGGGAAATIEPLKEHLPHYEQRLANLFGAGVQACYRGPRLYDSPETRNLVKKWVDFYKKYRAILDSDIIHVRRADGRQVDAILHVNPQLPIKGLAMIYNPTDKAVQETLTLPLYYTGLTDRASIGFEGADFVDYQLARDYSVSLSVEIEAFGVTWVVIR